MFEFIFTPVYWGGGGGGGGEIYLNLFSLPFVADRKNI